MNVAIVEDELPARAQLRRYLARFDPGIRVVAELDTVEETARWLAANPAPDLLLCDIQLLDGVVFSALELEIPDCPILFITAHDEFTLRAFDAGGIGYLLKPIEYPALAAALRRFERLGRRFRRIEPALLAELRAAAAAPAGRRRLVVKRRGGIALLETDQIAYIQMRDEIASAFTAAGEEMPLKESLRQLESMLCPTSFFRINRREIVAARFIEELIPYGDRLMVRIRGLAVELVTSAGRTPALRRWLES